MRVLVDIISEHISIVAATPVGAFVLSEPSLRFLLWVDLIALVAISLMLAERYSRKIEGARNNTAHADKLHRKRIRQYAWRRFAAVTFSAFVPGFVLSMALLHPDLFLGSHATVALTCNYNASCNEARLVASFIFDQAFQGALFDIPEIFEIGFRGYSIDLTSFSVKLLVAAYRVLMGLYGIAYIYLLGSIIIDRLMLNRAIGETDDGRKRYLNLSRLSRGGIFSGYVEDEFPPASLKAMTA